MSAANRLALGGGLVALVQAALGILALGALGPERIAFFLVACSLATTAMTVVVRVLITRERPGGAGGADGGEPSGGPPSPPPWWPSFERDFWQHVRRDARTPV